MIFLSTFQSVLALLSICLQTADAKAVDYPIGMSLGQYRLSSAYYNFRNELVNVATINSSQEWQDHYWETWKDKRKEQEYDTRAISIYSDALKSIHSATEAALFRPVEIQAITVPSHFLEGETKFNIRLATAKLRYLPEDAYDQIVSLYNAARLAHNLDNCKVFGAEEGCDIFFEDNFAVVIELAPLYLTFKFLSITDYYCAPEAKAEFSQYGEIGNSQHFNDPNSDYFREVASALKEFMDETIEEMVNRFGIQDAEQRVRGIILAGEASEDAIVGFRKIINASLPGHQDRFMFDIDASILGAMGAAHRARQWARQWAIKSAFMNPREPYHDDL